MILRYSNKSKVPTRFVSIVFGLMATTAAMADEIRVPAFTAYIAPDSEGAIVSEERGVSAWNDPNQSVSWYCKFEKTGNCHAMVELKLGANVESKLRLTIDGQSRDVTVLGKGSEEITTADFGVFSVSTVGYQRIQLESLNDNGRNAGELKSLLIDGAASDGVHFNIKERRNAASVHLSYVVPKNTEVGAFYSEVTAVEDPVATFYMACGWHRGYFGMQVNSLQQRRIIFSVWDSGEELVDRKNVNSENRVTLIAKGDDVFTGDFGNEGTGGHSHLKYLWKTGEKQKFLVTAEPVDSTFTIFSGYWFHPEQHDWMLISSWKAPKEGGWLRGLHSFSENFGGSNGDRLRKALYGNQWIKSSGGDWSEVTRANFSHDPTGKSDRLDRFMGVEDGQFFLSHGGFSNEYTKFGDSFQRDPLKVPPSVPAVK